MYYSVLEYSLKQVRADWLEIVFLYVTRWKHRTSTSCWRNDGASKENLHFDDQSKKVVSLLFLAVFSKGNRKHVPYELSLIIIEL